MAFDRVNKNNNNNNNNNDNNNNKDVWGVDRASRVNEPLGVGLISDHHHQQAFGVGVNDPADAVNYLLKTLYAKKRCKLHPRDENFIDPIGKKLHVDKERKYTFQIHLLEYTPISEEKYTRIVLPEEMMSQGYTPQKLFLGLFGLNRAERNISIYFYNKLKYLNSININNPHRWTSRDLGEMVAANLDNSVWYLDRELKPKNEITTFVNLSIDDMRTMLLSHPYPGYNKLAVANSESFNPTLFLNIVNEQREKFGGKANKFLAFDFVPFLRPETIRNNTVQSHLIYRLARDKNITLIEDTQDLDYGYCGRGGDKFRGKNKLKNNNNNNNTYSSPPNPNLGNPSPGKNLDLEERNGFQLPPNQPSPSDETYPHDETSYPHDETYFNIWDKSISTRTQASKEFKEDESSYYKSLLTQPNSTSLTDTDEEIYKEEIYKEEIYEEKKNSSDTNGDTHIVSHNEYEYDRAKDPTPVLDEIDLQSLDKKQMVTNKAIDFGVFLLKSHYAKYLSQMESQHLAFWPAEFYTLIFSKYSKKEEKINNEENDYKLNQKILSDYETNVNERYKLQTFMQNNLHAALIPINLNNNHWILIIIEFKTKNVFIVDSLLYGRKGGNVRIIHSSLYSNLFRNLNIILPGALWKYSTNFDNKSIQNNAVDCGIHLLINAEIYIRRYIRSDPVKGILSSICLFKDKAIEDIRQYLKTLASKKN